MAESTATQKKDHEETVAIEEEDEDYMGDLSKFLPTESAEPSKPKKVATFSGNTTFNSSQQPSKKKWKNPKLDREKKQFEEDQQTLANLETAIPESNIGFKLLRQMGYTPGSALGKEGSGQAEPIGLEIRRSRAGIGREHPLKEKARREKEMVERKRRREEELMEEFGYRQKLQWRSKRVVINYHKAKAALDQLENREPPIEPVKDDDEEGKSDDDEEEEEEEQISEEVDMASGFTVLKKLADVNHNFEELLEILVKLREEHQYCLFCGCQYESMEALLANCPGINEDDH
ncbi:hypothetical protein Cgig2_031876 [Carnegiea gigantea]|uniref:G-patch domain-containing protein n=1 Tax=Carnegiea gigantea TaxID=171969 RepID=A0A9Q1QMX9_9CARY|nr:hypothetical protein Cgig2_031876 [Carnegiea gigantea]